MQNGLHQAAPQLFAFLAVALVHCASPAAPQPLSPVAGVDAGAAALGDEGAAVAADGQDGTPRADVAVPDGGDAVVPDATSDIPAVADTTTKDGGDVVLPDATSDIPAVADVDAVSDAWQPAPIPVLDPEPTAPCVKAQASDSYFQFLDNLCEEKALPTYVDRELACPVADGSATLLTKGGKTVSYLPSSAPVQWADLGLAAELPPGLQVAVVAIRRVGGIPHYRYLSNGTAEQAVQPWSTTKILAAANAAATLRIQSAYAVGLTASAGSTLLGDLVTSVVNYDDSPFSSNALGAYFHNIGGRAKANALIHGDWLKRPASETFGGNYGSAAPGALGYQFVEAGGASVTLTADTTSGTANNLSMYTLAEAIKRLVLHREEPSQRMPGIQWKDVKVLLYGAENSKKYGPWGGMSADTAIYLQAGHDIAYLQARSQGQWRVFSKLGLGTKGQFIHAGYACFPALDPQGKPVPGLGREFVIAAHLATGGATWKARDRLLAKAYRVLVTRLVDGSL